MGVLDLPEVSKAAAVWRECRAVLRDDPALARVVHAWKGGAEGPAEKGPLPRPGKATAAVRLRPRCESASRHGMNAHTIRLVIQVSLEIAGLDPDDPMNLWLAVMRAFHPQGDPKATQAIRDRLVKAGADTGEPLFDQPADDPDDKTGGDGRWEALGSFSLDVIQPLQ